VTKTSAVQAHSVTGTLAVLGALLATALIFAPTALAAPSIAVCDGASAKPACVPTTSVPSANGVYFQVTTGGGNRNFASVVVDCDNGYGTVLTVEVPPKGTGHSQTIYPPAGTCTATLVKLMQIGKVHVLAGPVSFTVTP
jgi:hypothetical protein